MTIPIEQLTPELAARILQRGRRERDAPKAEALVATANLLVRRGVERALEKLGIAGYGDFQAIVEDSWNYDAPIDVLVEDLLTTKINAWLDDDGGAA